MMKKRVLALMMAGMMVFGGTMPVFAEADTETEAQSEDPIVWSYEDIDPDVYDGEWFSFEYGFDLYLPTDWEEADISDSDNMVYALNSPDGKMSMAITCNTAEEMGTKAELDAVKAALESEGFTGLADAEINGISTVGFDGEQNVSGIAFVGESGNMYSIIVGPIEDEDSQAIALNIFRSFSETETEADTEADTEAES